MRGTDVERFNAEVGYWISEKYWNQGIVSDALTEAIQYYFAHTEVIRIFATVYEYNPASMRVLEKLDSGRPAFSERLVTKRTIH